MFRALPQSLVLLPRLQKLNASRNQLRPNAEFLVLLLQAPGLPALYVCGPALHVGSERKDAAGIVSVPPGCVLMTPSSIISMEWHALTRVHFL